MQKTIVADLVLTTVTCRQPAQWTQTNAQIVSQNILSTVHVCIDTLLFNSAQ